MASPWMTVLSVVFMVGWLVAVAGQVALLVVIATTVRRRRPDAAGLLLAWSIGGLALTLLRGTLGPLTTFLAGRFGADAVYIASAVEGFVGTILGAGLTGLLCFALVRLAAPPNPAAGHDAGMGLKGWD